MKCAGRLAIPRILRSHRTRRAPPVCDQAVRQGLASSLTTVFAALDGSADIDPGRAADLLRAVESGPAPPGLFGAYVDLVLALFDDREDDARALAAELLGAVPFPRESGLVVTLDDGELGRGQAERYARLFIDDLAFDLRPVAGAARAAAEARLAAAFDLLMRGAPDVLAEMRVLVRQVVLVEVAVRPDRIAFGGASTFSLWGALAINADRLGDRLEAAVSLAHEAAHSLLFGLTLGGRLVENDDDQRYPSPLRQDLRPLEGVAHATFVTARMIHTLRALIASGVLTADETALARDRLTTNDDACARGLATVLAHARFTPAGAATFEALRGYFD